MNKDPAVELFAFEHGPSAPVDSVSFIEPIKGKLHGGTAIALDDPIVQAGFNGQEAQPAEAVALEREMSRADEVEILGGP
jgi:hypothetical protein